MPRPYEAQALTYYPSDPIDTARRLTLNEGAELSGIDIQMRDSSLFTISGRILPEKTGSLRAYRGVVFWNASLGSPGPPANRSAQQDSENQFKLERLSSGDYCLQSFEVSDDGQRITGRSAAIQVALKNSDISGLNLTIRPTSSLTGNVLIEPSAVDTKSVCASAPRPLMEEIILAIYPDRTQSRDQCKASTFLTFNANHFEISPDSNGAILLDNPEPGRYHIEADIPDRNYYVKTIAAAGQTKKGISDADGINIGSGQKVNVTVKLAAGAASITGKVAPSRPEAKLPPALNVLLIPAQPEFANDVLRFAESTVGPDGAFNLKNLAPGRYFLIARPEAKRDRDSEDFERPWWNANKRAALIHEANKANSVLQVNICQNIKDYVLVYSGN